MICGQLVLLTATWIVITIDSKYILLELKENKPNNYIGNSIVKPQTIGRMEIRKGKYKNKPVWGKCFLHTVAMLMACVNL